MTVTCPEGHRSEATDYCDTCGVPIGAAPSAAAGPPGADLPGGGPGLRGAGPVLPGQQGAVAGGSVLDLDPAGPIATVTCPHCGGINLADALFCEACGYDFTTGAAPLGEEPTETVPVAPEEAGAGSDVEEAGAGSDVEGAGEESDLAEAGDVPAEIEMPAERDEDGPAGDEPEGARGPREAPAVQSDPAEVADVEEAARSGQEPGSASDGGEDPASEDPQVVTTAPSTVAETPQAHPRPRHTPPSRDLADLWVVEVWVDPDWYAVQQTDEACPSTGVPDIVVVRRNVVLVGRPSGSLAVRPDVDAGADSAVSRRHAQLTSDGTRWWIEDLGSSNGTFVGVVGDPLPTEPITPGQRVEIDRDDRIYVGAWTRLVVRQATASEKAGQG